MTRNEIIKRIDDLLVQIQETIDQKDRVVKYHADTGDYLSAAESKSISLGIFWFKRDLEDLQNDINKADEKMAEELGKR